jgi:hypothetical protein
MTLVPSTFFKLLTSFALIVAMAASGFAHTGSRAALTPELMAYVAAGGSLADICGAPIEQDGAQGQKCEACRLMGAAILPRTCHGIPVVLSDQTRKFAFVAKRLHHARPLDPSHLTRAPPQA